MNEPRRPANTPDEDALFAFGDDPNAAPANDLERTVRRLQRATGVDTATPSSIPTDLKHQIWEDLMHAQTMATPVSPISRRAADLVSARSQTASSPITERQGVIPSLRGSERGISTARRPRVSPLQIAINVTLAAALVLVATTTLWRVAGNPFSGPGDDPPPESIRYAAFQDGGQEELFEVAEVPDPSECTVEPLTVDEVMARIQDTQFFGIQLATPSVAGTPTSSERFNQEVEPSSLFRYADQGTVDAIEASQRQWLACNLAGDLFRVWSLESGGRVRETILSVYGPLYSLETIRADLERLAEGNGNTPFQRPAVASDTLVPMAVTSGFDTYHPYDTQGLVLIPLYWSTMDGSVAGIPSYLINDQYNDPAYAAIRDNPNLANQATYIFDPATEQWLLDSFQSGGRG